MMFSLTGRGELRQSLKEATAAGAEEFPTPAGSIPNWETVMRYVEACDGHMLLGFSLDAFDEAAFLREDADVIAAVAV